MPKIKFVFDKVLHIWYYIEVLNNYIILLLYCEWDINPTAAPILRLLCL
jgi:hypothetical protein